MDCSALGVDWSALGVGPGALGVDCSALGVDWSVLGVEPGALGVGWSARWFPLSGSWLLRFMSEWGGHRPERIMWLLRAGGRGAGWIALPGSVPSGKGHV